MEEIIKNILENPVAMEKISGLMQALGNEQNPENNSNNKSDEPLPFGLDSPETLFKLGKILNDVSKEDDPRINLLKAIKPYMSEKRERNLEQAVQILKLTKMTSFFKEINVF